MKRNLLVVRAGDQSLHREWIEGGERTFDLFVSYFGDHAGRFSGDGEFYEAVKGLKFPRLAELLESRPELMDKYDYIGFPDDDLKASRADWNKLFSLIQTHGIDLAQPAIQGHIKSRHTAPHPDLLLRWAGPVETMSPIFSRKALIALKPSFSRNKSGRGLEYCWARLIRRVRMSSAIVDAVTVTHTRPCGTSALYKTVYPGLNVDPELEHKEMVRRLGGEVKFQEFGAIPLVFPYHGEAIRPAADPWTGRIFSFGAVGHPPFTKTLRLGARGRISGYGHRNEALWDIRDNVLHLLGSDGRVTSSFPQYDRFGCRFLGSNLQGLPLYLRDGTPAWTGLPVKSQFEIVVARYTENLKWTEVIEANATVYNKGPSDPRWHSLPNIGREAHSYLYHIITRWEHLADRTLFLQGDPFDHPLYPLPLYLEGEFTARTSHVKTFESTFISAAAKRAFWRRYIRTDRPDYIAYAMGAQFSASASAIRKQGYSFWKDLFDLTCREKLVFEDCAIDNYGIGILLEFFWRYAVNPNKLALQPPIPIKAEHQGEVTSQKMMQAFFKEEGRSQAFGLPPRTIEW